MHPSLDVRVSPISGHGLFATTELDVGIVVIRLGGRLVSTAELHRLFADAADGDYVGTFALGDDMRLVVHRVGETADIWASFELML